MGCGMTKPKLAFATCEEIRAWRKKRGLRQGEFWGRIGITQSGGSRYERGRNIPYAVQMLLTVTYGTEGQARKITDALRAWKTEADSYPNAVRSR